MEILNHNHPRPNCPACEQVGRWQAEETVRHKLEAAEEMAARLRWLHREYTPYHSVFYEGCRVCAALSAWEKVGKGRKS